MKSQKGITLIALVITIIVMLILVTVTITMAVKGGLFDYARDAATNTNGAQANEQELGEGLLNVEVSSGYENTGSINSLVHYYTATGETRPDITTEH